VTPATAPETVVELQSAALDKYTLLEQAGEPLPVPKSARVLGLAEGLLMASRHNRDYLTQEETLYLSALGLTLEEHLWSPRFRTVLSSDIARTGDNPRNTPWDAAGQVGMALALPDGGNVDLSMNTGIAGDVTTSTTPETAVSTWVATISQPLLRGFGRTIAQEPLVQAERNVVYAVRTFERYRRTFAVQVAGDFFRTLQQVDAVRNQWENYQRFIDVHKMTQALADAGRVPAFQVDQARQDELSARNSWVTSIETYEVALDQFKIELGLSTEVAVILDSRELDSLRQLEAAPPEESVEQATAIALANRLDLMVVRDQVADAERRVHIAQDQLRGDLSLTASATIESGPDNEPMNAEFHQGTYRAGLNYNLPVDRLAERNRYRQALISLNRGRRSLSLTQDTVVLQVRTAYRGVQQALETYRIQQNSLDLARRRVESTSLLLRAGRATTRDLLDSQNAYVLAQNQLTRALVDLFVARLALRRDMDALEIDEKGAWSWPQVAAPKTGETNHE
jgi:outer membrane protein TolC